MLTFSLFCGIIVYEWGTLRMKPICIFMLILGLIGCVKETQPVKKEKVEIMDLKGKKVLMIIASSNFRDEEYLVPQGIFKSQGLEVVTAASSLEISRGVLGAKVKPDILITQVKVADYEAICFVGGGGAVEYWESKTAHNIAQETVAQNKILAAICIAPVILANANVLKGKKATVFASEAGKLKAKGVSYTGTGVEIDGNIITANGPQAAEKFAQAIVKLLK
ncbi:MAG: DJ-1/PfpI family protein [bacterium]|nr:DJ-1/PfpI family protein [bacterium]